MRGAVRGGAVVTSRTGTRWPSSVFGTVPAGVVRRRPSDAVCLVTASVVVAILAGGHTDTAAGLSEELVRLADELPSGVTDLLEVLFWLGAAAAGALVVAAAVGRRWRLLMSLVLSGAVGWGVAAALAALVDGPSLSSELTGRLAGARPDFPVVALAASSSVLLAARPFLTRPARRVAVGSSWAMAVSALVLVEGLPASLVASLALAWGAAALVHLGVGSPGGVPSTGQVRGALAELGLEVDDLAHDPDPVWGRTTVVTTGGEPLTIDVLGRDSTDAQLIAKLWRFAWYKDSGPSLLLRRRAQLEREALLLLLAERTGARVPTLVAMGVAGDHRDAVLVVTEPTGRRFGELAGADVSDPVLADAWANLATLHRAGIAHGGLTGERVVVDAAGRTGLRRLDRARTSAPPDQLALDAVQLLVITAARVGAERALEAAHRALTSDGLAAVLPFLVPAAVTDRAGWERDDLRDLLARLQEQGSSLTGTDVGAPAELRRFSASTVLLAGAFALGVYLLVGQLAGVAAMGDVFAGADWGWVGATAVLAQLPQVAQAVAMTGAVATALPLRTVALVQFAQAFTGLIGGTAGNATLTIRFFQKQGLPAAVAVSSGVLSSLAGFVVQAVLVVVGLAATGADFDLSGGGAPDWLLPAVLVAALVAVIALVVPALRRRIAAVAAKQVSAALENVREIARTPAKAAALFGGNLVSQLLFAVVLGAALDAYGESLPLLQLVVINSFASLAGGLAPVPGGLGVVESGMIAGFTAAGIPEAQAVAATMTARMFTTYLPPIWGWLAFQSLRRHDQL